IPGSPTPPLVTRYFTDFTEHAVGAEPAGWSNKWVPAELSIAEAAGATGVQVLRMDSLSTARVFYVWQYLGTASIVEIVGKFRVTDGSGGTSNFVVPGLCVRGTGSAGDENGYRGFLYRYSQSPRLALQAYVQGEQELILHEVTDPFT